MDTATRPSVLDYPVPARALAALVAALTAVALVGCGPRLQPIPPGAQQVHIVITESDVILDNGTVRAGPVYLVLDAPESGSIVFVQAKRTAAATPGPLTGEDIGRLAKGDTQWTAIEGMESGSCSAEQNAEARGKIGYCGNVFRVTLAQGFYAILGDAPELQPPMAVLEVRP